MQNIIFICSVNENQILLKKSEIGLGYFSALC